MAGDQVEERVSGDHDVIRQARAAADAFRAVNEATGDRPIPATLLTHLLGNLQCVMRSMPQLFSQLGTGLQESLDAYQVFDRDGDPQQNVTNARAYLVEASELAYEIAYLLEEAQSAIALQSHRAPPA